MTTVQTKRSRKDNTGLAQKCDLVGEDEKVLGGTFVKVPEGHQVCARARRYLEQHVHAEVKRMTLGKGHCREKEAAVEPAAATPSGRGCLPRDLERVFELWKKGVKPIVFVDVGGAGGVARLDKALGTYKLGDVIRAVSLNPLVHAEDYARETKCAPECNLHRKMLKVVDTFATYMAWRRLSKPTVGEMLDEETIAYLSHSTLKQAHVDFLSSQPRWVLNFTHSWYYMSDEDKALIHTGDLVFAQVHMFRGQTGVFPTSSAYRQAEMAWKRTREGYIRMVPLGHSGTPYEHADHTRAFLRRWETLRAATSVGLQVQDDPEGGTWLSPNCVGSRQFIWPRMVSGSEELHSYRVGRAWQANNDVREIVGTLADLYPDVRRVLHWSPERAACVSTVNKGGPDEPKECDEVVSELFRGVIVPECAARPTLENDPWETPWDKDDDPEEGPAPPSFEAELSKVADNEITPEAQAALFVLRQKLYPTLEDTLVTHQNCASTIIARFPDVTMDKAMEILRSAQLNLDKNQRLFGDNATKNLRWIRDRRAELKFNTLETGKAKFEAWLHAAADGIGVPSLHEVARLFRQYGIAITNADARQEC